MKIVRGSGNVFRDLGFSEAEANILMLRADLLMNIQKHAKRLGPMKRGLKTLLQNSLRNADASLDALVSAATRASLHVELRIRTRPEDLAPRRRSTRPTKRRRVL